MRLYHTFIMSIVCLVSLFVMFPATASAQDNGQELISAVRQGNVERVEQLIHDGVNLGTQDIWGKTPLIIAASLKDQAIVNLLLTNGANVNATDNWQRTPLIAAVQANSVQIASILIDHGADVNRQASNGISALIAATQRGNIDAVDKLISAGAKVNQQDSMGWTPLMWAAKRGSSGLISNILQAGADINCIDRTGRTVLDQAEELHYSLDIMGLLRSHGAVKAPPNSVIKDSTDELPIPQIWDEKRFSPNISGSVSKGNEKAVVTIVEYTDFQCPYCSVGATTVEQVLARYEGEVRLVVKHLPLEFHQAAMPAAIYFESIARQDVSKAWLFYEYVFRMQDRLKEGDSFLRQTATDVGADMARLKAMSSSSEIKARIAADVSEADRFGFDGVPTFLINGRLVDGAHSFTTICRMIDEELMLKNYK